MLGAVQVHHAGASFVDFFVAQLLSQGAIFLYSLRLMLLAITIAHSLPEQP